ncbi:MAG: hypothetical protein IJ266_02600 [Elusimicrobiaceae bacterium]|nr:hypothetical protein [Elusimicrobiaceae bacterium]
MKKVLTLAVILITAISSFALNAVPSANDLCQPGKDAFEQLSGNDTIVQKTLELAASLDKMTNSQALPAAACYATYQVQGQSLLEFARAQNDYRDVVIKDLRKFADRVETLSKRANGDVCLPGKNEFEQEIANLDEQDFSIIQSILRLADSLEGMDSEQALPVAACYATYQVNGKSLPTFIHENNGEFRNIVNKQLASFAHRLNYLTK